MAITLEEAKVGMTDRVVQSVVDQFQRSSILLDRLTFDNCISPVTGGSTLGYSYTMLKTPSTAGVRKLNEEYKPNEAKRSEKTTQAIIMGGSFEVDRVIQSTSGAIDEIALQTTQKVKAASNMFHNLVINGAGAQSPGEGFVGGTFDGLHKLLTGTDTEVESSVSLATSADVDKNYNYFMDEMDEFLGLFDGTPGMLMMNNHMLAKMRAVARRAGYYERTKDDYGRVVETYNGIPMVDLGKFYNGSKSVDVVADVAATSENAGTSSIYAVTFGLDAFHGISPTGSKVINTYMPNPNEPGALKKGEVELIAGVALKNSRKAGVLHGIATSPATMAAAAAKTAAA